MNGGVELMCLWPRMQTKHVVGVVLGVIEVIIELIIAEQMIAGR